MKKYLLPETGSFYKANLHSHSTLSDGCLTPEVMKGAYMAHGYSIVAFTDHDILIGHNELTDNRFLALNGLEYEICEPMDICRAEGRERKQCHFCFIALDPDNLTQPCWHREKYLYCGNAKFHRDEVKFDESKPDYEREYSVERISEMMKIGREEGFFVTYNHPVWSFENYEQYAHYEGMHAMEICNYGSFSIGYPEYNPAIYDDMLRTGKRIYCIATDDNHDGRRLDDPAIDSFGGFTMIKAEALEYKAVTDALVAGNFYASQGPEIKELYFEDGKVHIKTSPAKRIYFSSGKRHTKVVYAQKGEFVSEAVFDVLPTDVYFRLTVDDAEGKHANTNAYFVDELFEEEAK